MNNNKFIMVGAPIISKELFRSILRPLNNYSFKPSGGFWACKHINNISNISEWFTHLMYDANSIALYKNLNQSTIFALKDSAKILTIDSSEQILELAKKYPSYHHILGYHSEINDSNTMFDFEILAQDYDGVYINFDYFNNQLKTKVFDSIRVNSLFLFNLNCIKEYQTALITYDIDKMYSIPYIKEENISHIKTIEEESNEHYILSQLSKELFQDLINKYCNYTFQSYDEYLSTITQTTGKVISLIDKNESKTVNSIVELLETKEMNVKKELIIQNIVLNCLSGYIKDDAERIKNLPKSKIKSPKSYSIY